MLILLARLGLRAAEVAGLRLEDLRWRDGEGVVRGKSRRTDRLPLPADVGDAVVQYLRKGRPVTEARTVFVTLVAPRRPLHPAAVSQTVQRQCRRAGLPPVRAHALRHALATNLLERGVYLPQISQLLRHADLATTSVYAMSTLDTEVDDYLRLRRALGHKLVGAERYLRQFTAGLDTAGTRVITMQQVLAFVSDPDLAEGSAVPQHRLMAVRGFARYLAAVEPRTQVPPAGLVTYRARRRIPYLFTDDEIDLLVAHARTSTPRVFRADTLEKMIRLLAVTGMRVGEAIRLERDDIDWSDAVIHIRDSKFNKSRHVPVSASTIEALHSYATTRDQRGRDGAGRFFVSLRGTPVDYNHFRGTFHTAVNAADIGAGQPNPPRIHDLRH